MTEVEETRPASGLAEQYAELWNTSQATPDVFSFLAEHADAAAAEQADVLFVDQFQRAKIGSAIPVEEYLTRFPNIAGDETLRLQLIVEEFGHRQDRGESPLPQEFAARFPDLQDRLLQTLSIGPPDDETVDVTSGVAIEETHVPGAAMEGGQSELTSFAGYELLHEIARGGMGVVYKARQTQLNRIVALKMIRSGELAGEEEVRRFHAEAEAAAQLDHPNIVPIYEVGEENNQHFFSMGFVDGRSLAEELQNGPLPPRDAAVLLQSIAEAVQFAHEKQIVHRDLKPANVLLTGAVEGSRLEADSDSKQASPLPDGRGSSDIHISNLSPKITDFGLAKNIAADSGLTATGQILGTPSYMPPEQAAGDVDNVGPLADVYSLGAMLYATLTGRPPFQAANVMETLKQVLEREPVSPRTLNPAVDRDLETICLKCLEKEPSKRYVTARDVADDLDRYRAGKPITARPIGPVARSWRWCLRNKLAAAFVGVLVFLSIGGPLFALNQMRLSAEATHQRDRADEKVVELAAALERETAEKKRADTKAAELASALTRVTAEFDRAENNLVWADEVVKSFVLEIGTSDGPLSRSPGTQLVRKRLMQMGREYYEKLIAENPGANLSPRLAEANAQLGYVLRKLSGRRDESNVCFRKAVSIFKKLVAAHPEVKSHRANLGSSITNIAANQLDAGQSEEALASYGEALSIFKRLVDEDPEETHFQSELASTYNNIGIIYMKTGKPELALAEYKRALAINESLSRNHPDETEFQADLANTYNAMGTIRQRSGKPAEALGPYRESLAIRKRLAENEPDNADLQRELAAAYGNLGGIYAETGAPQKSLELNLHSLKIRRRLADSNPLVVDDQTNLADGLENIGTLQMHFRKFDVASDMIRQAITIREGVQKKNPDLARYQSRLASSYYNYGNLLDNRRKPTEALKSYHQALTLHESLIEKLPEQTAIQRELARCLNNIGNTYRNIGRPQKALPYLSRAIPIYEHLRRISPENPALTRSLRNTFGNRALTFDVLGRYREAVSDWQQALKLDTGPGRAFFQKCLCLSLANSGQHKAAVGFAAQWLKTTKRLSTAYDYVCAISISADAAMRDVALDVAQRRRLADYYGASAITVLKALARARFFESEQNLALIRSDDDLNPLRHRGDFRAFAKSIGLVLPARARKPNAALGVNRKPPIVAPKPSSGK